MFELVINVLKISIAIESITVAILQIIATYQ